jgi:photosystem II PsbW protein
MSTMITTMNISSAISTSNGTTTRRLPKKQAVRAQRCVTSAVSLKREAAKLASLVSAAQTLPALAIVDDRLNGDGTGLPLGINDGALGIILATVPLAVFSLYFIAGKQDASIVAGGKDDDSGLSL